MNNKASVTAFLTAYARAYHSKHDASPIFDDYLASELFSDVEENFFEKKLIEALKYLDPDSGDFSSDAEALSFYMHSFGVSAPVSRARYSEDILSKYIQDGMRQYVILGAGFDTFAFRNSHIMERLSVFEVDHAAVQEEKKKRIEQAGWSSLSQLHFLPIDFEMENIGDVLLASSFNPSLPSFISWLGVTYYLSHDTIIRTLRSIADVAPKGSIIVFDYMDADAFDPSKATKKIQRMQAVLKMTGEPFITGFEKSELSQEINTVGWELSEYLSPQDIQKRYFRDRTDGTCAHDHICFAQAELK